MGQTCESTIQQNMQFLVSQPIIKSEFEQKYIKLKQELQKKYTLSSLYRLSVTQDEQPNLHILNIKQKQSVIQIKSPSKLFLCEIKQYMPYGMGILIQKDYCYIGQYKNGLRHGKALQFKQNMSFQGYFAQNYKIKGKFISPQFHYQGEFYYDLFQGQGKIHYHNQNFTYQGNFKNGLFQGKGTLEEIGKITYIGNFKQGLYHGKGVIVTQNGDIFSGFFKMGLRHGKGKLTLKSGVQHINQWQNDSVLSKSTSRTSSPTKSVKKILNQMPPKFESMSTV